MPRCCGRATERGIDPEEAAGDQGRGPDHRRPSVHAALPNAHLHTVGQGVDQGHERGPPVFQQWGRFFDFFSRTQFGVFPDLLMVILGGEGDWLGFAASLPVLRGLGVLLDSAKIVAITHHDHATLPPLLTLARSLPAFPSAERSRDAGHFQLLVAGPLLPRHQRRLCGAVGHQGGAPDAHPGLVRSEAVPVRWLAVPRVRVRDQEGDAMFLLIRIGTSEEQRAQDHNRRHPHFRFCSPVVAGCTRSTKCGAPSRTRRRSTTPT